MRETRLLGRPSAPAAQAFNQRLAAMAFSSPRLLYGVVAAGLILAGLGLAAAITLTGFFFIDAGAPAWTFIIAAQCLIGGVVTTGLGIIGLYIERLFEASRDRPLYFIEDRIDAAAQVRRKLDIPMPPAARRRDRQSRA